MESNFVNIFCMEQGICAETQPEGPYKADKQYDLSQAVVTRLISDISGSAQNITFDNWCASIMLVKSLFCDHNLTVVGTLRKNKCEIPQEFLVLKTRPPADSMFGFRNNLTLVSCMQNIKIKTKNVTLISSMHHDNKIDQDSGDNKKPEIITLIIESKEKLIWLT